MRIGGLASGMDIDSLVMDLMKAERMPLDKLFQKRQTLDWQRDAYRDVNLQLSKFRDNYSKMRLQSAFNAYGVTSSNESAVKATASSSASPGTYEVANVIMAKMAKVNSTNAIEQGGVQVTSTTKVLAAGATDEVFKIQNGSGLESTITVTDADTFGSLAKKIAEASDTTTGESLGLRANFDNTTGRFFFSTKEMGASEQITFVENANAFVKNSILNDTALSGTDLDTYTYSGQDGSFTFDGIAVTGLTSNETTVNGINISLLQEGQTATLIVQSDTTKAVDMIKDFVESYNELIASIDSKLNEPRYKDYPPLTDQQREGLTDKEAEKWDEKAQSGLLRNDPLLRSTLTELRRSLMDPVEGIATGEIDRLSQIGITTGNYRDGGKLFIDEDKLKAALTEKPDEVMNLFTKSAEVTGNQDQMGVGKRVYEDINFAIGRLKSKAGIPGVISADQSVLGKNLNQLDDQISRWEDRMVQVENRYWRQFTAMEKALNQMNQQSSWMMQNMFGGQ
jgi:flagellar hook-associated protein 2